MFLILVIISDLRITWNRLASNLANENKNNEILLKEIWKNVSKA